MNDIQIRRCLHVMDKMLQRPICSLFMEDSPYAAQHVKKANMRRKTKSLEQIRASLIKQEYTFKCWMNDVMNFWSDQIKHYNDWNVKAMARDLSKWFEKRCHKLESSDANDLNKWAIEFIDKYNEFKMCIEETSEDLYELGLRLRTPVNEPLFSPFEPIEVEALAKAIAMVDDDNTMKAVLAIVVAHEGKQNEKILMNAAGCVDMKIETFQPQTHYILRDFLQKYLQQRDMSYPSA